MQKGNDAANQLMQISAKKLTLRIWFHWSCSKKDLALANFFWLGEEFVKVKNKLALSHWFEKHKTKFHFANKQIQQVINGFNKRVGCGVWGRGGEIPEDLGTKEGVGAKNVSNSTFEPFNGLSVLESRSEEEKTKHLFFPKLNTVEGSETFTRPTKYLRFFSL